MASWIWVTTLQAATRITMGRRLVASTQSAQNLSSPKPVQDCASARGRHFRSKKKHTPIARTSGASSTPPDLNGPGHFLTRVACWCQDLGLDGSTLVLINQHSPLFSRLVHVGTFDHEAKGMGQALRLHQQQHRYL